MTTSKKQTELSSRTLFFAALGVFVVTMFMMNMVGGQSSRFAFMKACYSMMCVLSLFGFVQSIRKKTRRLFRYLNLLVFLFTVVILYLMGVDFLGAIR